MRCGFAFNDLTAVEVIKVLKDMRIAIPDEIAVLGFSNDYISEIIEPSLTTVAQPANQIGEAEAKVLIDRLIERLKAGKRSPRYSNG